MAFDKKEDGYNVSDLGNWNVASDYSRLKIMKPLDYCDHYENIARFGYDTLLEQLENFGIPLDTLKLIGLERLVNELIKLCCNSKFAMKVGKTREDLENFEKRLIKIREAIPLTFKIIFKNKQKTLILKEEVYYKILDMVINIKSSINEPLNKNHLIFTDKLEFNPQEYKNKLIEDATLKG